MDDNSSEEEVFPESIFSPEPFEPKFDVRHHVGLSPLSFHMAANMLKRSFQKCGILGDPVRDLRARFHPDLLPSLRSARRFSFSEPSQMHEDVNSRSLPGLGSEFWQHAKAHLYDFSLPPKIDEQITEAAKVFYKTDFQTTVSNLKVSWTNTSEVPQPLWDDISVFAYEQDGGKFLVARLPLVKNFDTFQDGSDVNILPRVLFHGTRESNVPLIQKFGLHSSSESHGVVGLWLNDNLGHALTWNTSVCDILPALCFEVAAHPVLLHQNRKTKGRGEDRDARHVLRLNMNGTADNCLPKCRPTSIIFGLPSSERVRWHQELKSVFYTMTLYLASLPLPHDFGDFAPTSFTVQFYEFVSFRLAYRTADNSMSPEFGGFYDSVFSCMIPISIAIVYLLYALQLQSVTNRTKSLMMVDMGEIPKPFRDFISERFPNIYSWTNCVNMNDTEKTQWTIGPITKVSPWSPVRIDSSNLA